jgi:glyoxylase-like metal-dependent hydrolase (beta-lactamase superfamily II)
MIEEIRKDLYRIVIPLPNNPLRSVNSYVIRGAERNLIIDTALNRKECLDAFLKGVNDLAVDLAKTDFLVTHFHTDHLGLVGEVATKSSKLLFNQPELNWMLDWGGWDVMLGYGAVNGFPRSELEAALKQHPGNRFAPSGFPDIQIIEDGTALSVGDFAFRCVSTPGHSPGHICLYEAHQKLLISGDHVLGDITPNIQCWSDTQNPLKDYLDSLDKVRGLDVALMLPGHRSLITRPAQRIDELEGHHRNRLNEILAILTQGPAHAYQVASQMKWDIDAPSWEQFPVTQKWFATGEAIAHLRYLEESKAVRRIPERTETEYELVNRT